MPTIDLSSYVDRKTGDAGAFDSLLIKKSIRDAIADRLYELMVSPLKHSFFKREEVNYFVAPSIDSVDESRFLSGNEKDSSLNDPDLPGLYVVFEDDLVNRDEITNINWTSESTLTITYFRKSMDNPDFDTSLPASTGRGNNPRKVAYTSKTTNLLVEDLEVVALMFDFEIQKSAQAGLISGVVDTRLLDATYTIPPDTGRVYGSVQLRYNIVYRVDYRNLGRV